MEPSAANSKGTADYAVNWMLGARGAKDAVSIAYMFRVHSQTTLTRISRHCRSVPTSWLISTPMLRNYQTTADLNFHPLSQAS